MQVNCGSLLATAAGGGAPYDYGLAFFAPVTAYGRPGDGSPIAPEPFWAKRLGKSVLRARQASRRGGACSAPDPAIAR